MVIHIPGESIKTSTMMIPNYLAQAFSCYGNVNTKYITLSFIMLLAAAVENMGNLSVILTVRIMLIYLMTQLCKRISL